MPRVASFRLTLLLAFLVLTATAPAADDTDRPMLRVVVGEDGDGFRLGPGGERFVPFGFNYDHDADGELIEDYWHEDWDRVVGDFEEMAALEANVVRVHLQFGRFMDGPNQPNERELDRLAKLLKVAERCGLYLNLTGLGCYHKDDVPDWYDEMDEIERWAAQAVFWQAVAEACAGSPAVFCYDLMNEPVVPGGDQPREDWLGGAFAGKHFVQFITLDRAGRDRPMIARRWIERLTDAIREHDPDRLITIGLVPWSLDRPGLTSGFVPGEIADRLDFIAMHLYPEEDKLDEAIETLRGFDVGKPVVIEETFPLRAGVEQYREFLRRSKQHADGWFSFYWGTPPEELREQEGLRPALIAGAIEAFTAMKAELVEP